MEKKQNGKMQTGKRQAGGEQDRDRRMDWYRISGQETLERLHSSRSGISQAQAERLLAEHGENVLKEEEKKKAWQVFLEQFQDLLVVILIVAAVISMLSDNVESTAVIFAVLIMNAVLGTVQHEKAQKSLESLKALSAPVARVMRDGRQTEVLSAGIVPGDIVLLEAGELVPADGRILECAELYLDESSLTGESGRVEKQAAPLTGRLEIPLAERSNMVFSGSLVTGGRGVMAVTATGMDTEIGRIAILMNETKEQKTPLQVSLDQFSGRLAAGILLICALVFAMSLYRNMPVLDSLMFAVALAVAAIPEVLGSIVTIVQAMGTQQMAAEHAIIKELKAVESLGCVSVICSDKTGTLTQNRMSVQTLYAGGKMLLPPELRPEIPLHRILMYASVLDNDASGENGDSTEQALLKLWSECGVDIEKLRRDFPRVWELPFDPVRKLMSTGHRIDGEMFAFTKGAPDVVLARSEKIQTADGVRPMTSGWRKRIQEQNEAWGRSGCRVIALAYRTGEEQNGRYEGGESAEILSGKMKNIGNMETRLIFLGLAAIMDPPRPESRAAVQAAKSAGIRPVMITGDHPATAAAVAEQIGILEPGQRVVTGSELDKMSESELAGMLPGIAVYARVSPEHKLRIVEAWQRRGQIVAMTGDGVNDAPALKKADIGVAMGIAGTEVAKDAAAMILTDDNFATIIRAVSNGRNVYRNIRNAIRFLLSGNMAGILCVLYTSLFALPLPFAPVHLLFINLLTDSLPAIAIGMEPQEDGLLKQPPRDPKEGILTGGFLRNILMQGALIAVCTILAYHVGLSGGMILNSMSGEIAGGLPSGDPAVASTMAFATLTLARLFHGFNCRSEHSMIRLGLFSNLWSVMAFEAGTVLLAAVLFLPGLQKLFAAADLSLGQIAAVAVFAALPTILIQAGKLLREAL